MAKGHVSITAVPVEESPFKDYDAQDWALYFIARDGRYDGEDHKAWALDQVARILQGAQPVIERAHWACGTEEYRVSLAEPPQAYYDWVAAIKAGEDGPDTYGYDEGCPP